MSSCKRPGDGAPLAAGQIVEQPDHVALVQVADGVGGQRLVGELAPDDEASLSAV